VPKENLVCYAEFAGLDARAEAWKKTAAYKMLNQTPLGVMLEEVSAQLLEKGMSVLPNRKLSGSDMVTLVKNLARNGWVFGFNASLKGNNPIHITLVMRNASNKDTRKLTSGLLGMMMGADAKAKIDRKAGRPLVVVSTGQPESGWAWWSEKNDLVICQPHNSADLTMDVIDGKVPSAASDPRVTTLSKPEGTFLPLMLAFLDPAAGPSNVNVGLFKTLSALDSSLGIKGFDYRWGFDDDALVSVTRMTAPKPRKGLAAAFDQSAFEPKSVIPLPEGVDSFVVVSASPAKIVAALPSEGPTGGLKEQLDEVFEKVRTQNRINVEKDLFENLGPKMTIYLAPGRSATTSDETPATPAARGGLDFSAMLATLQSAFPKPTLVAELHDPTTFGKALDAFMIEVNKELRMQAVEQAAEEAAAEKTAGNQPGQGQGPGQFQGSRRGGEGPGSERAKGKRRAKDIPAPEFRMMPGTVKTYMFHVPPDSPVKYGPPSFRPTIRIEGKYVAFSTSADSARAGLEAVRKKGWKPSSEVEQALAHLPSPLDLLMLSDPRETLPTVLASLPGTLQAHFNTAVALSAAGASGNQTGGAAPGQGPGGQGRGAIQSGYPGAPGSMMMRRGMRGGDSGSSGGGPPQGYPGASGGGPPPGYGAASSGGGPPPGYGTASSGNQGQGQGRMGFPGTPGGQGPAGSGSAEDSMIVLKVDPAKLPKAEDLKALLFPTTLAVTTDDQTVRIVTREAFPSWVGSAGGSGSSSAAFAPFLALMRGSFGVKAATGNASPPGQGAPVAGQQGAGQPATGTTPPAAPGGPGGPAMKGRGGRRGGRAGTTPD
jgi:hypothetical protein